MIRIHKHIETIDSADDNHKIVDLISSNTIVSTDLSAGFPSQTSYRSVFKYCLNTVKSSVDFATVSGIRLNRVRSGDI